jgi:dynein heavy chain 1
VDTEFVQIMRRIATKPNTLEALQVENLLKQLLHQEATMTKIQKALGEYLANQREAFSRFYFVGDEDLLEIIGNSGEPVKVMAHLSKMFAAISGMVFEAGPPGDSTLLTLTHMSSKDGESVELPGSIAVKQKMAVRTWLKEIEDKMQSSLADLLSAAVSSHPASSDDGAKFVDWASSFPAQIMILSSQIAWSMACEKLLSAPTPAALDTFRVELDTKLNLMARTVLSPLPTDTRKKFEQLITELVHQRDVTRSLHSSSTSSPEDFNWLYHLRFHFTPSNPDPLLRLNIRISNASFFYGFEYLGIGERLVQTPLTDRCYLTLTQALHFRMGGNPFGPAGTGKTESVKALGAQLGRFVLVFNCDEAFDFSAMGRLFAGLCQVGAWGCFDEFNRLEERILSAVSQQIQTIQIGLREKVATVALLDKSVKLDSAMGVFVSK